MNAILKFPKPQTLFDQALKRVQDEADQAIANLHDHSSDLAKFENFCNVLRDAGCDITPAVFAHPSYVNFLISAGFDEHSRHVVQVIESLGCKSISAEAHDLFERIQYCGADVPTFTLSIYAGGPA